MFPLLMCVCIYTSHSQFEHDKRGFKNWLSPPSPYKLKFHSGDGLVTVLLGHGKS